MRIVVDPVLIVIYTTQLKKKSYKLILHLTAIIFDNSINVYAKSHVCQDLILMMGESGHSVKSSPAHPKDSQWRPWFMSSR